MGAQGWLDWKHARQLVRVQRISEHPVTGKRSVGNRYYVLSETSDLFILGVALYERSGRAASEDVLYVEACHRRVHGAMESALRRLTAERERRTTV